VLGVHSPQYPVGESKSGGKNSILFPTDYKKKGWPLGGEAKKKESWGKQTNTSPETLQRARTQGVFLYLNGLALGQEGTQTRERERREKE